MKEYSRICEALDRAEAIIIGAGAGMSASAGFAYTGERFERYFGDFARRYGFSDMYSGGFYPFATSEEYWAYWSRYIYINRYTDPPLPVYGNLLQLVGSREYFVLTTNVDHCFQKNGFERERLFYTQGDYGLFQCSRPCHKATYDNEETVRRMVKYQGYHISDGALVPPRDGEPVMTVPSELVPLCPRCGEPMSMNLRADDTFVEDRGWYRAEERYESFLKKYRNGRALFLELGVGFNTPGIIKYPFWQMTAENPEAYYVCINYSEAFAPREIENRSAVVRGDIGEVIKNLIRSDS